MLVDEMAACWVAPKGVILAVLSAAEWDARTAAWKGAS